MPTSTHDRRHSEEARAKIIGKRIHVWGLVALLSPQKLQICKLGDISAIRILLAYSTKNDELRKDSSQEYKSSVPWIEYEIITLLQKEHKHFLYNGWCTICFDNNASEAEVIEEGEPSNSLTTWARCKVLNLPVRNAETNFGRQSPSHHYVPVCTLEEWTWNFDSIPSESLNWPDENLQGQAVHDKN